MLNKLAYTQVEDGSEEALDHALADINEWLDKEFDFSSGSGRSTPQASAAVMAQDLYPSEWESLLALHRKVCCRCSTLVVRCA
jgi:hypothetical protein